jgi:hypothetical protein
MREHLARGADTGEVRRIVKRRKHGALVDHLLDLVVDACRRDQPLAAMDHPVTDGAERRRIRQRAAGAGQMLEDRTQRADDRAIDRDRALLVNVHRVRRSDSLRLPDRQACLGIHLVEVVLDRRRAHVDDQNLHDRAC